ncbi:MAG: AraC family transcriptional regulator [Desulfobacterales bacterium]
MTHCDRINRALEFIEANLDNEIHLDSLAKESAFSKYHFHRIFRALIGDPPFKYIEKRRISKAAHDLLHSEKRIVDIAFDYGFNSHESFIRAFRKSFHQTPSHFRKTRPTVEFHAKCQLGALELMLKAGAVRLNPRIWHQPSFLLAGLAYSGRDSKAIYGLWEKFWQAASKAGKKVETAACYGACFHDIDMRNREVFDYYVGIKVNQLTEVPKGMKTVRLPENTYALFTHRGPISEIELTYDRIYGNWLPLTNYTPTMDLDIIVVDHRFSVQGTDSEVDILIPIQG